jgi:hypothetical protein
MALPTLSEIRSEVLAWWREPGRPRLPLLRARLTKLVTDPRSSVLVSIQDIPVQGLTLIVELFTYSANGAVVTSIQRQWQPANERPGENLLDVIEDTDKRTRRSRGV